MIGISLRMCITLERVLSTAQGSELGGQGRQPSLYGESALPGSVGLNCCLTSLGLGSFPVNGHVSSQVLSTRTCNSKML